MLLFRQPDFSLNAPGHGVPTMFHLSYLISIPGAELCSVSVATNLTSTGCSSYSLAGFFHDHFQVLLFRVLLGRLPFPLTATVAFFALMVLLAH